MANDKIAIGNRGVRRLSWRPRAVSTAWVLVYLLLGAGCRELAEGEVMPAESGEKAAEEPASPEERPEPPKRLNLGDRLIDQDRWLFATDLRDEGDEGGWATASFNQKRNRLTIETHNLSGFTVNMSKIPIRWENLVVLSIDGRTSELRQRDLDLYPFVRNKHGAWEVKEIEPEP